MLKTYLSGLLVIILQFALSHPAKADSPYLFVWAADADREHSDFVAVVDADPQSRAYGEVLTTIEVGVAAQAHHSEHRMPDGGKLFVNGFASGHSFVIDLTEPLSPSIESHFTDIGEYSHPHSFERLPNGNVLATFQNGLGGRQTIGGLVELSPTGEFIRAASAAVPEFPDVRAYSLTPLPGADRVVTTTSDMWGEVLTADSLQFWRLSDLSLLSTIRLPAGPRGDEQRLPAEARLMADGRLMANTFMCGLYQVEDFAAREPQIVHVYTFELEDPADFQQLCALPVTFGPFWVQTVPSRNGLVSLDLSDERSPDEVSYVNLGEGTRPHWIALEPDSERIVVTGFGEMLNKVMLVNVNPESGALSLDRAFGDDGVLNFDRADWPHGETGAAIPHGSVFSGNQSSD
jgi:hypothetical protein